MKRKKPKSEHVVRDTSDEETTLPRDKLKVVRVSPKRKEAQSRRKHSPPIKRKRGRPRFKPTATDKAPDESFTAVRTGRDRPKIVASKGDPDLATRVSEQNDPQPNSESDVSQTVPIGSSRAYTREGSRSRSAQYPNHAEVYSKQFKCSGCDEAFAFRKELVAHQRETGHEGLKGPFTEDEVKILTRYKNSFCADHGIDHYTFNIMMTEGSRRGRGTTWSWPFINRKDFFADYLDVLPYRDRRSMQRYRERNFQNTDQSKQWTEEDDDELVRLIKELGTQYVEIGLRLNRTQDQVSQRWRHKLSHRNERITGRWSVNEDNLLEDAVRYLKAKMSLPFTSRTDDDISWSEVSTRTAVQCSQHWKNVIGPLRVKHRAHLETAKGKRKIRSPSPVEQEAPRFEEFVEVMIPKKRTRISGRMNLRTRMSQSDEESQKQQQQQQQQRKQVPRTKETRCRRNGWFSGELQGNIIPVTQHSGPDDAKVRDKASVVFDGQDLALAAKSNRKSGPEKSGSDADSEDDGGTSDEDNASGKRTDAVASEVERRQGGPPSFVSRSKDSVDESESGSESESTSSQEGDTTASEPQGQQSVAPPVFRGSYYSDDELENGDGSLSEKEDESTEDDSVESSEPSMKGETQRGEGEGKEPEAESDTKQTSSGSESESESTSSATSSSDEEDSDDSTTTSSGDSDDREISQTRNDFIANLRRTAKNLSQPRTHGPQVEVGETTSTSGDSDD